MISPRRAIPILVGGVAVLLWIALFTAQAQGAAGPQEGLWQQPTPAAGTQPAATTPVGTQDAAPGQGEAIPNEVCLGCHNQPNLTMTLANGDVLSLYAPGQTLEKSVHGANDITCVQCHTDVGNYPHPPFTANDRRDAALKLYPICRNCHEELFQLTQDSVHQAAMLAGNREAAVCTDCHTAHATRQLTDPQSGELLPDARPWVSQTCAKCHNAIYQKYAQSVHGAALLNESNPDVPTCIDCHGVHNIENPTTAAFRLRSPDICAKCHTDPTIMDKYGISTQVLSTYVADFHGTTVTLFQKQHPDQETNKPVCFDCHGIHDIARTDDPVKGLKIKENILTRCQACHPGARENFPDAWLSHYIPSPQRYPIVYTVNLFYSIFIPAVLGGMAILVVLDVGSILRRRRRPPAGYPEGKPVSPEDVKPAGAVTPAELVEDIEERVEKAEGEAQAAGPLSEEPPAEEAQVPEEAPPPEETPPAEDRPDEPPQATPGEEDASGGEASNG